MVAWAAVLSLILTSMVVAGVEKEPDALMEKACEVSKPQKVVTLRYLFTAAFPSAHHRANCTLISTRMLFELLKRCISRSTFPLVNWTSIRLKW
jgi:hypothetical protein